MFDFGLRLCELRKQHHLSQEALGKKINRSKSVISSYENNLKVPSVDILTSLSVLYNVSLDYLVGIDKKQMVSVDGLNEEQKSLLNLLIAEFREVQASRERPTQRQREIINLLLVLFAKQK